MLAHASLNAFCICGRAVLELKGAPITSLACYCNDCQAGARQIEVLPGAPLVQTPDCGTAYVVYRKDRVQTIKGANLLRALKLRPTSSTNRVIASCCSAAMFLNFDGSKHWVDFYRERIGASAPPLEMRVCTKSAPKGGNVPADVPGYTGYPLPFLAKLIGAKLAMLFGR
jgi:hypothetical protein